MSGCPFGIPEFFAKPELRPACAKWTDGVIAALKSERPKLVILSNRQASPTDDGIVALPPDVAVARATAVLRRLQALDIPVIVLKNPPYPDQQVPHCIESKAPDLAACTATMQEDYYATAAVALHSPKIQVVALDPLFRCVGTRCPTVIGNVIVYMDDHHLTATMAKSLTPFLDEALLATGLVPGQ